MPSRQISGRTGALTLSNVPHHAAEAAKGKKILWKKDKHDFQPRIRRGGGRDSTDGGEGGEDMENANEDEDGGGVRWDVFDAMC